MKKTIRLLGAGMALALSATVTAGSAEASDQITASFARMLQERSPVVATRSSARLEDDPLYRYVTAAVWELQPSRCTLAKGYREMTASAAGAQ